MGIKSNNLGFTLIEMLLVIAIFAVIFGLSTVFYSRFINQNAVANTVEQLLGDMRKSQIYALSGRENSNWGVNFSSSLITLYKGNSFEFRNPVFDEKFSVNSNINVSGFTDINFSRMTGIPNVSPVINVSGGNNSKNISVNSIGTASK